MEPPTAVASSFAMILDPRSDPVAATFADNAQKRSDRFNLNRSLLFCAYFFIQAAKKVSKLLGFN
jgi:hypothetical protein